MSDELDPGLRRLFASTAEAPADEAFVSAVTVRTSRERRISLLGRGLALGLLLPAIAAAFGLVLDQSVRLITPLLSASPMGWAAGLALAFAGFACFRALSPLVLRR